MKVLLAAVFGVLLIALVVIELLDPYDRIEKDSRTGKEISRTFAGWRTRQPVMNEGYSGVEVTYRLNPKYKPMKEACEIIGVCAAGIAALLFHRAPASSRE